MTKASVIGISRLRIGTDGNGITTLVAFHGCSLRCQYCLNPSCLDPDAKIRRMTPEDVMIELKKDELYYIATNGGVTFGGGEPLLNSQFIKEVLDLGAKEWNVTVESSLNVPRQHLELLLPYIDGYIVDIKDMDSEIYEQYTGKNNEQVKSNLKWLVENGKAKQIICRIPLILGYNDPDSQKNSKNKLIQMGLDRFDLFTYTVTKKKREGNKEMTAWEKFRLSMMPGIIADVKFEEE
jgi:pyruvate formate lyase activating enzyme